MTSTRVEGVPSQEQITNDSRSACTHDAVHTVCTAMLASGTLGQHNELPVTVVATTTLAELTAGRAAPIPAGAARCRFPR